MFNAGTQPPKLTGNVIAVIDAKFAILHENFRNTDTVSHKHITHIEYFQDQDEPANAPAETWDDVWPFGYGGELRAKKINDVLIVPFGCQSKRWRTHQAVP